MLSARGGMLQLLRPVFLAGFGGRVGEGRQWLSWIDLDDLIDVYARALVDENVVGPVNAVTPNPVRNQEFTLTLAHVLHRPACCASPESSSAWLSEPTACTRSHAPASGSHPARFESAGFRFDDRHSNRLFVTSWDVQNTLVVRRSRSL